MPTLPKLSLKAALDFLFEKRAPEAWVTSFPGNPHNDEEARWKGGRADELRLARFAQDHNAYVCRGILKAGAKKKTPSNVEAVRFILIEDVGTKVERAAVRALLGPPSWAVETSAGNEQYVYRFDRWETNLVLDQAVMMKLVEKGLTDKGCKEVDRYLRLPYGVNGKPAAGGFLVRLTELNPDVWINLTDLAMQIEADLDAVPPAAAGLTGALRGTAKKARPDTMLLALTELGMIVGDGGKPGVVDIVCPWVEGHTARADTGTAYLGGGLFSCHHGHCAERKSPEFAAAVLRRLEEEETKGRPAMNYLAAILFDDEAVPAVETEARAVRIVGELREREATGWAGVLERYVYVEGQGSKFADLAAPEVLLDRVDFEAKLNGLVPFGTKGLKAAGAQFVQRGGRMVGLTYAPGQAAITADGKLNQWRPAGVVLPSGMTEADVAPWLAHRDRMIADPAARLVLLDFMSFVIQRPGEKVNWMLLLHSDQGGGKGTLFQPLRLALGENFRVVRMAQLEERYTPFLRAQVILVDEMLSREKYGIYEKLKSWVTDPPDRVEVRDLHQRSYDIENFQCWIGFTNNANAIPFAPDDRRYLLIECEPNAWPSKEEEAAYFDALWAWLNAGGAEKVAGYLRDREISASFNPHALPQIASVARAKRSMALASLSAAGQWIAEEYGDAGLVDPRAMLDDAGSRAPKRVRDSITKRDVTEALRALGAVKVNAGNPIWFGSQHSRTRLWAVHRAEMYAPLTADELRAQYLREASKDRGDKARGVFGAEEDPED